MPNIKRQLKRWCAEVLKINSTLNFKVSSRGWCYILEEHGLEKGDFDDAQKVNKQLPQEWTLAAGYLRRRRWQAGRTPRKDR